MTVSFVIVPSIEAALIQYYKGYAKGLHDSFIVALFDASSSRYI